jgi:8-oxo-dGTP pyrophosphatase MutT (NUDIX family)/phosphohistidine phosphatase SixA
MIKAAGAVVWREEVPFEIEVLLVHRPQYDDWSFPKGKVEDGESSIAAAFREVKEETGVTATFTQFLGTSNYKIADGKKKVKYWMAQAHPSTAPFVPNVEVDKIEWVSIKEARHFLTHDEDREILDEFFSRERFTSTLILLRHAKAVRRSDWNDYDLDRPLSEVGVEQSKRLVRQLEPFGIEGIFTSDASRCFSTVEPLSLSLDLKVTVTAELNEETFESDPRKALNYVRHAMRYPGNQIIASHNPIIPHILTKIARVEFSDDDFEPADAWVVHHLGDKVHSVEYLRRPKVEKQSNKED